MHYKEYKSILSSQNGINIYRGCTHGCIYCDSRSTCYHIEHAFTDIEVKKDAPLMLDLALSKKRKPIIVGTGAMSDPYNHIDLKLGYTHKCLDVILKHRCGVAIQTKSDAILRDIDLLEAINKQSKAVVEITLTTADDALCQLIEPNVSPTSARVKVLSECMKKGIPTVVWLCPILPFINDTKENLLKLLDYCIINKVYGVICFGFGLTLREGNREYFYQCLDEKFPGMKEKYIQKYGDSYQCNSEQNDELLKLFYETCQKNNIVCDNDAIFAFMKKYPIFFEQISIFEL